MSAAENLNNAIVQLDYLTTLDAKTSRGVKRAVADLSLAWLTWWNGAERQVLPALALHSKLERWAAWYTRAYAISRPDVRAKAADPRTLDASWAKLAQDALDAFLDASQVAADGAVFIGQQAGKLAAAVAESAESVHKTVRQDVVGIVVLGVAGLLAYGWMTRGRA